MNGRKQSILSSELRNAGANDSEVAELLSLAADLGTLLRAGGNTRSAIGSRWRVRLFAAPAAGVLAGIVVAAFILVFAQAASPNSWLFPMQKASDSVVVMLHPQYREVVMMKRADQVNELVASHASSQRELKVLADYMKIAEKYKATSHANYAAFQYCESKLAQAAKDATPQVSHAIQDSLEFLDTT